MIRAVGFLDLSQFTATFVKSYRDRLKPDASYEGAETLLLRGADADAPILKEWASARKLFARLKNEAAPFLNGKPGTLGKAMIVQLKPGSFTPWRFDDSEYAQDHLRLYINMLPSPRAWIFSGGMVANPPVGEVNFFDAQQLHSEINLGPCPRVSLIVDVKRPDDPA